LKLRAAVVARTSLFDGVFDFSSFGVTVGVIEIARVELF
jgi:hypothetical protein